MKFEDIIQTAYNGELFKTPRLRVVMASGIVNWYKHMLFCMTTWQGQDKAWVNIFHHDFACQMHRFISDPKLFHQVHTRSGCVWMLGPAVYIDYVTAEGSMWVQYDITSPRTMSARPTYHVR